MPAIETQKPVSRQVQTAFLETAEKRCGLVDGKVLVALSGGPDSVVLLHLMTQYARRLRLTPLVGHVDHQLRAGAEADRKFCEELAAKWGLEFHWRRVDTRRRARAAKQSVETAARELRYAALREMAASTGCHSIVLGHTMDDQAETVLHNMLRGTGPRGLGGMLFRHGRLARPLLSLSRRQILGYLAENKLAHREDESNQSLAYRRNLLRHKVMPVLEKRVHAGAKQAISRTAAVQQEADAYLQASARQALAEAIRMQNANKIILDIEQFRAYFAIIRKYAIRQALSLLSRSPVRLTYAAMSRADRLVMGGKIGKRLKIHQGWELLIDHDGLVIWDGRNREFDVLCPEEQAVAFGEQAELVLSRMDAAAVDWKSQSSKRWQFVDADKIQGPVHLRTISAGDRFQPLGMSGSKKVIDYLADEKVPLHLRRSTAVLSCDRGIIWVVGYRIDERFKATPKTRRLLSLKVQGFSR